MVIENNFNFLTINLCESADLSGVDCRQSVGLKGDNLKGANLRKALLSETNLCKASFSEMDLSRADLSFAYLNRPLAKVAAGVR